MRRSLADAILMAFKIQRDPIPDSDLDDEQPVTLHVTFKLGDLRSLKRTIDDVDRLTPHSSRA